jgi:hypothetical protein
MAKKKFKVYIDRKSNTFVGGFEENDLWRLPPTTDCEIRAGDDFYGVLQFIKIARRPLVGMVSWWKDVTGGTVYPMPLKHLEKLLLNAEWQGVGLVDGRWRFTKTGICFVPADEAK